MATAVSDATASERRSGPGFVVALAISLIVGGIAGGGFGAFLHAPEPVAAPVHVETKLAEPLSPQPIVGAVSRFPPDAIELPVQPIIVTIGTELKTNIRLEFSIVAAGGTPDEGTLKGEIREDVIAYLKGLAVADLEGGRRFQLLREQLDDRARVRGRGVVLGILISGLVVQ